MKHLHREIPEEGVVWLYCLFCFCVVSCNYSKQSKSHQATFEANWVCVRNGVCHQAWRMCRVEVEVPLVAAGCNCRVAFYPQGSWRYWWSKCTEAPSRPVEDSREPLWPQCSWWALIFKFEVFDCFLLELFSLLKKNLLSCLVQPLWWSYGIGSWKNPSSPWTSTSSASLTAMTQWRPLPWCNLCLSSTGSFSATSSTSCR